MCTYGFTCPECLKLIHGLGTDCTKEGIVKKGNQKSQESLSELASTGGFPQLSHWKPGSDQINTVPGSHSLCGERAQVPLDRLKGCQPGATLFRSFAPLIPEHLTVVEQ